MSEIPDKPLLIDDQGFIDIPILGRVRAGGLTPEQLRADLLKRLSAFVQTPQVTVALVDVRSRPVTVVGAVMHPGTYQIRGNRTLLEVLSLAGGLAPDAGRVVKITRAVQRGCPSLSQAMATTDSAETSEIPTRELLDSNTPALNVELCPHDIVAVPKADMIYVVGEVQKPGAFVLSERAGFTVLQALSMAGGLTHTAASSSSRIIKSGSSGNKTEIVVNLKSLMGSKGQDVTLTAGDILFVPNSISKTASRRAIDAAIQLAVGVAVFRR